MNTTTLVVDEQLAREAKAVIEGFLARWEEPSCSEQAEVVARAYSLLEQLKVKRL